MTKAQAVTVVGDLVTADYSARAVQYEDGTWAVQAYSKDGPVNASVVAAFATSHGVTGRTNEAEFI